MEAGFDSQGDNTIKKALARSKIDLEESTNRIKDRRYAIKDQLWQAELPVESIERVLRAFNRGLAAAIASVEKMSI